MRDESLIEQQPSQSEDFDSASATLEPTGSECSASVAEWTGPRCEKCDAPMQSDVVTICRRCGWYPSLGTFVEVDPNWETSFESAESAAATAPKSHVRVWLDMVPRWGWVILASVLAVVVESVIARFVTPAGSYARTVWSLTQLTLGFVTVAGCHIFNFLVQAADDADFGILDLFLKPLSLWIRAVRNLPARLWVTNSAACGAAAIIMSLLVIGGIPYERLWDWGIEAPPQKSLMGAVMDRAKKLDDRNGADSLEEAVQDFAGKEGVEPGADAPKPDKPRKKIDCVILGYQVDREGRLATLLLGTAHRGKLIFAGRVTPEMPEEERTKLLHMLASIKRPQAFIPVQAESVTWVHPNVACRATYGELLRGGRFRDLQWDRLLGSMDVGK